MQKLSPHYFFDLQSFPHEILFSAPLVWDALTHLAEYLASLPLGKIEVELPPTVFLENRDTISIGKGTIVEAGAFIRGPCFIGNNCSIRHGAYIRGNVLTGDGCVIGHDTEAKNAILLNRAHAAHFAYLGDTILGNDVNLGAGTICANLKFDRSQVEFVLDGERFQTGKIKLGAILGDRVQTGCHTVLNPGTLVGKESYCYPCVNISGFVPEKSLIKPQMQPKIISKA